MERLPKLAFRIHLSAQCMCVNLVSISFQGRGWNIFLAKDGTEEGIQPFIHKLNLWHRTLGKGSSASFLTQKECKALSTDNIHPGCHCQSLEWTAAESIFHNEIPMGWPLGQESYFLSSPTPANKFSPKGEKSLIDLTSDQRLQLSLSQQLLAYFLPSVWYIECPDLPNWTLKGIIPFPSISLCKVQISAINRLGKALFSV